MYQAARLSEQECQDILFEGGFPILFKECVRRNLPFPHIDDQGMIQADADWWSALQYSK
jgi:tRNA (guanosine-2'-O-)-methyltransferase